MKIGNNGNLVLGPFDESTPGLMIVLMNCQTKLRINHLIAVKSVAILEKLKSSLALRVSIKQREACCDGLCNFDPQSDDKDDTPLTCWRKNLSNRFSQSSLDPISYPSGNFTMREKGGNPLVPGPDCMVDALKLPNQAVRVSGESLQLCVAWRCPDGTQRLFCWSILAVSGQSLASNGLVVDS
ncbi:hypothetical protein TNCV_824911 [Trichonephila clavipes]|nr:hypothetical protein TNCV_824911 [Trichonephila clavipes]